MTSATETTIRVPVRTWQEKAILAAALTGGMPRVEGIETKAGFIEDLLLSSPCLDRLLDLHFAAWAHAEELQNALRDLRAIEPGPHAWLDVAPGVDIQRYLDEQVVYMGDTNVDELLCEHPSKRDWAEATVTAIDLLDELVNAIEAVPA